MILQVLPFIFPIIAIVVILVIVSFYSKIKKKTDLGINIPERVDESGYSIPLIASFLGIKKAPFGIALGHNSAFPLLVLFHDHIEYRVFSKKSKSYNEIEYVDIRESILTKNIVIAFKDSYFTFSANLMNKDNLIKLLHFFDKKGVFLKDSAKNIL